MVIDEIDLQLASDEQQVKRMLQIISNMPRCGDFGDLAVAWRDAGGCLRSFGHAVSLLLIRKRLVINENAYIRLIPHASDEMQPAV